MVGADRAVSSHQAEGWFHGPTGRPGLAPGAWVGLAVLAIGLSGCTIKDSAAPPLTGPSELGLSLQITANPDTITQDGLSQSQIMVVARDANGQSIRDLPVRAEITVSGTSADFGKLSARTLVTGTDGRAAFTYTAPPPPFESVDSFTVVTILISPSGTDIANLNFRSVNIRLVPPGTIIPPNRAPTAAFSWSPTAVEEGNAVTFDASASRDEDGTITSYAWDFGDGTTATGVKPTKTYNLRGTYNVTLTVTDDRRQTATLSQPVTVNQTGAPAAQFTLSPSTAAINQLVTVNATGSTAAAGRRITDYEWTWGDGSSSEGISASHRYTTTGNFNVTLTVTDDLDKTGTASQVVLVTPSPVPIASFVFSPTTPQTVDIVNFDGTPSTAPAGRSIARWEWNFGDGERGTGFITTHRFTAAGSYSVLLTVVDSAGSTGTSSQLIVVGGGSTQTPTASFDISPNPAAVGQTITVDAARSTAQGGQQIVRYEWNFGDSPNIESVTTRTHTHVYTAAGSYQITLTVIDGLGRRGSASASLVVNAAPQVVPTARFVFSPQNPTTTDTVNFDGSTSTATTGRTITGYSWNFGDGTSATGPQATKRYTVAATYVVSLTVTDNTGATNTQSQNVIVTTAVPTNPTARFVFSPNNPTTADIVNFDGSSSTAVTGRTITNYAWNFGDGTTGAGPTTTRRYTTPATYVVSLTVTDNTGATNTLSQSVTVTTAAPTDPTARFTFSPSNPTTADTVNFDGSGSTAIAGRTITNYRWNFGDGGSATGVTTTHKFTSPATYVVSLTVTDSTGASNIVAQNVTVTTTPTLTPTARFTFSPSNPTTAVDVNFDGTSSTAPAGRTITSYFWNFGDGSTGSGGITSRKYPIAATYVVQLTVTDSSGATGTTSQSVVVTSANTQGPTADFDVSPSPASLGNQPVVVDASRSSAQNGTTIVSYQWNWGDNTTIETVATRTHQHTYTRVGAFTITLTVTDSLGRTSANSKTLIVNP